MNTRSACRLAVAAGVALEVTLSVVSGQQEAWDSSAYWTLGYPGALLVCAAIGSVGLGCRGGEGGAVLEGLDGPGPVDDAAMVYLMAARGHHARADLLADGGDSAAAAAEMEALLSLDPPAGPVVQDAQQDAWARLARLKLRLEPPDLVGALAAVDAGLAVTDGDTFYVANLLLAQGEVLEAKGELDAALDAYDRSIAINKRVLERLGSAP